MTRRLYVIHPRGWRLPHYGARAYGEYFEDLPEDVHNALAETQPDTFSKTPPKAADSKPAPQENHEDDE